MLKNMIGNWIKFMISSTYVGYRYMDTLYMKLLYIYIEKYVYEKNLFI